MPFTVLILGGYGNFGSKIARRLAICSDITLIIAGRNLQKAAGIAGDLQALSINPVHALQLDTTSLNFGQSLTNSGAQLLIHTSGPFQLQNYRVAETCIENGIHYIDLADGRSFVANFNQLNGLAKSKGVLAITGASTVPGLSSAVITHYIPHFAQLEQVDYGISPGNRAERGEATVAAILGYTGHAFTRLEGGNECAAYGWQSNHQHNFPTPLGKRWLANCDIPDISLFPAMYPSLHTLRFYAGLELPILHLAMAGMSWLSRLGIVNNWAKYARTITRLSRWFERFGSDIGGMYMRMQGTDHNNTALTILWQLVAEHGDGPFIPAIPAVILAKKLAAGSLCTTGAMPCTALFTLDEFFGEITDLAIQQEWEVI